MTESFVAMLDEPKNTLGRTEEVVALVLADPSRIDELYQCYFQPDEWVRLRTSSSFKRIWRVQPELIEPYLSGFVADISQIDQPSAQWTFAQLCQDMSEQLTPDQVAKSKTAIRGYLEASDDWVVKISSIETLGSWAVDDAVLRGWLRPKLDEFSDSLPKSVAKRANKWIEILDSLQ